MTNHYREQCIHGTVTSQCRCASKDKTIVIVDCPDRCPQKGELPRTITDEDVLRGMDALKEFNETHNYQDHQGEWLPLRVRAILESLKE